jgi:hypothetical protein
MSGQADKLRKRNTNAPEPCIVCPRLSEWSHHVAGHANAPEVTCDVCRAHADLLDAFLRLAGTNLKHGEPRTTAELVWAAIAGVDGLRAARDGKAALSPAALAAGRLIATHSADVRGPRPAATDARHSKRSRPGTATASFEVARVRAMHDLLAALPGAAERLPPHLLEMLDVLADPKVLERLERIDSEAIESLRASYERATVELLDAWRAAEAGDPDAQAAVALAERRFERATCSIAEAIACALSAADCRSREASA